MDYQKQYITFVSADLSKVIGKYELNMEESLRRMMDRHTPVTIPPPSLKELISARPYAHVISFLKPIMSRGILRYQDQRCNQYPTKILISADADVNTNEFIYIYEIIPDNTYSIYPKFPWIIFSIEYHSNSNNTNGRIVRWDHQQCYSLKSVFNNMVRLYICKTMLSLYSRFEHKRRELKECVDWPLVEDMYYEPINYKSPADGQYFILNPFSIHYDLNIRNVFVPNQLITTYPPFEKREYVVDLNEPLHPRTLVYACRIISQL